MPPLSPAENTNSVGCGLAGCLGGIVAGIAGSSLLLLLAALMIAINASVPAATASPPGTPDLSIVANENFLNRFAEQPEEGSFAIDVQPGNQVRISASTVVDAFGLLMPVEVIGRFELRLQQQTLQINLIEAQILGLDMDTSGLFTEDIVLANQNLQNSLNEISQVLGMPLILTGLNTTDTQIIIDIEEAR